jgi:transposase
VRHIGVDLSRNKFTACFLEEDDSYSLATFPLVPEGLDAFRAQLCGDDRLAVEAGQNTYFFFGQVQAEVAEVVVVATHKFAVIAQSKQKTDRNDAVILARFLKLGCLPAVVMPEERVRELRNLFTARDTLVKMARQLKCVGHAALIRNGVFSSRSDFASHAGRVRLAQVTGLCPADRLILDMALRGLEPIEGEIVQLERSIIRLGKNLPGLKRLLQVRGFGLIAAIGVLAEIGEIRRFPTAKQLVSYAGLATAVRQSGNVERHGHITKAGRKRLRGFMIESVLSMIRNPGDRNPLADFYQRKRKEKGPGKAICAAARKLLTMIYTLLTKDVDYWFLEERLYLKKLRALGADTYKGRFPATP